MRYKEEINKSLQNIFLNIAVRPSDLLRNLEFDVKQGTKPKDYPQNEAYQQIIKLYLLKLATDEHIPAASSSFKNLNNLLLKHYKGEALSPGTKKGPENKFENYAACFCKEKENIITSLKDKKTDLYRKLKSFNTTMNNDFDKNVENLANNMEKWSPDITVSKSKEKPNFKKTVKAIMESIKEHKYELYKYGNKNYPLKNESDEVVRDDKNNNRPYYVSRSAAEIYKLCAEYVACCKNDKNNENNTKLKINLINKIKKSIMGKELTENHYIPKGNTLTLFTRRSYSTAELYTAIFKIISTAEKEEASYNNSQKRDLPVAVAPK